jgi:hypothetical protein
MIAKKIFNLVSFLNTNPTNISQQECSDMNNTWLRACLKGSTNISPYISKCRTFSLLSIAKQIPSRTSFSSNKLAKFVEKDNVTRAIKDTI